MKEKKFERIHSWSGFSEKLECRAFPTLSIMADVVIEDSIHRIAAIASSRVTTFLNISLACAGKKAKMRITQRNQHHVTEKI